MEDPTGTWRPPLSRWNHRFPRRGLVKLLRIHTSPTSTTLETTCITKNVLVEFGVCNEKGVEIPTSQLAFWTVCVSPSAARPRRVPAWVLAAGAAPKRPVHGPADVSLPSSCEAHPYLFVFNVVFC